VDRKLRQVALYWDVAKVKGHGVRTENSNDGMQRYHLVLPQGRRCPARHVPPKVGLKGSFSTGDRVNTWIAGLGINLLRLLDAASRR
jgi:hypothetical protein